MEFDIQNHIFAPLKLLTYEAFTNGGYRDTVPQDQD